MISREEADAAQGGGAGRARPARSVPAAQEGDAASQPSAPLRAVPLWLLALSLSERP